MHGCKTKKVLKSGKNKTLKCQKLDKNKNVEKKLFWHLWLCIGGSSADSAEGADTVVEGADRGTGGGPQSPHGGVGLTAETRPGQDSDAHREVSVGLESCLSRDLVQPLWGISCDIYY